MKRALFIFLLLLAVLMPCGQGGQRLAAQTQTLMNKPYIDNRRFHWGFYLGMNMMESTMRAICSELSCRSSDGQYRKDKCLKNYFFIFFFFSHLQIEKSKWCLKGGKEI